MTDTAAEQSMDFPVAPGTPIQPERVFNWSIVVSAVRCTLTYVIFPFVAPLIGLAPGVGPTVGIVVGTFAIAANVYSLRRFWSSQHRLRRPITVVHVSMIVLLTVLIAVDINTLAG